MVQVQEPFSHSNSSWSFLSACFIPYNIFYTSYQIPLRVILTRLPSLLNILQTLLSRTVPMGVELDNCNLHEPRFVSGTMSDLAVKQAEKPFPPPLLADRCTPNACPRLTVHLEYLKYRQTVLYAGCPSRFVIILYFLNRSLVQQQAFETLATCQLFDRVGVQVFPRGLRRDVQIASSAERRCLSIRRTMHSQDSNTFSNQYGRS